MSDNYVMITGTSQGIGLATAKKFLEQGYKVIGIDVKHIPKELALYAMPTNGCKYVHIMSSLRDFLDDSEKYIEIHGEPPIQVLINNAGVQNSEDDIQVNLKDLIDITETFGIQPNIKSILMVGSVSAHTGEEFPYYAASKGGILPYTKNVANRVAQWGATCNSISPGGVLTELNRPVIEDDYKWNKIMDVTPLKKWATPEEIADWIYFITMQQTSMTGQDVIIDNGENINSKFVW